MFDEDSLKVGFEMLDAMSHVCFQHPQLDQITIL
jgi:hypothetical protein